MRQEENLGQNLNDELEKQFSVGLQEENKNREHLLSFILIIGLKIMFLMENKGFIGVLVFSITRVKVFLKKVCDL